ncbi:UNVERIFIED_ORG: anti-sigma B factor antagonist [Microbispora rosea subsp. rosea]|uniref:STAS domain-containing protein n=1 Tax=Microbispora sp. H10830 TaxID=2729109 RepID=UPI001602761F|nr:STAS domain-containing protein [Microbispora sp. H10830]
METWTAQPPAPTRWWVLGLRGELDLHAVRHLREPLLTQIEAHGPWLAIDLSEVRFIDTTGVGLLVRLVHNLRDRNGDLALIAPAGQVLRILRWTNLTRLFRVLDTADALDDSG